MTTIERTDPHPRSLLTPRLEIDQEAVAALANEQYLAWRASWQKRSPECRPSDKDLLRQAGAWARATAEAAQSLAVERDRRARLTEAQREIEDLLDWRARISNPLTCPDSLFQACGSERVNAELARVDARLAALAADRSAA